jgi:hypothetical protein
VAHKTAEARTEYQKSYRTKNRDRILRRTAQYRAENRAEIRQKDRDRAARNREARSAARHAHREANIERYQAAERKRRYGLTEAQFAALYASQNGACAICRRPFKGTRKGRGGRPPSVDHCHKTGRVRGLLCGTCNTAIGKLGDDPDRLHRALAYLGHYDEQTHPRCQLELCPLKPGEKKS